MFTIHDTAIALLDEFKVIATSLQSCNPFRIKRIEESRLVAHWRNLHWPSDNSCDVSSVSGDTSISKVTVMDMSGSFFILGVGCTIALLIFATEFCTRGKALSQMEKDIVKPFAN